MKTLKQILKKNSLKKYRGGANPTKKNQKKSKNKSAKKKLKIRKKFKYNDWIGSFMKDNEYKIVKTLEQGDCFFDCIQKGHPGHPSVEEQRYKLTEYVTQELLDEFKTLYLAAKMEVEDMNQLYLTTTGEMKNNALLLLNNANFLLNEFDFMKNIKNIDDLNHIIQTNKFWANIWAIKKIEEIYNIKIMIFSLEKYNEGDYDNIIQCGEKTSQNIINCLLCSLDKRFYNSETGIPKCNIILDKIQRPNDYVPGDHVWIDTEVVTEFKPSGYIMVSHRGDHYEVISHKNKLFHKCPPKKAFELFYQKCAIDQKFKGEYSRIPLFK